MQKFNPEQAMSEVRREFGEHGGVVPSVERSSTFTVMKSHIMAEIFAGEKTIAMGDYYLYSRHFNPTVNVLGRYLAAMEGTESAICTASGISAISSTLLQLCSEGDHIVSNECIYGGTHALMQNVFPKFGINTTFVNATNVENFLKAKTAKTKVFYTEILDNPLLQVTDIISLSKIAKENNIILVVDNTFTPMIISPAKLGADIVIYSMTKFINGASDVVAGAVCASKKFIDELMDLHNGKIMLLGPTMDPRVAFDIMQRLPHLGLRMREHSIRAMAIAKHLQKLGVKVGYPGLESHPQHQLFTSLMNSNYGYGGMLTIDCETREKAEEFLDTLQNQEHFGLIAVSLGYFDTLMSCSGASTSSEINPDEQKEMGLSSGLIRMAVGFTGSLEDRIVQIERAVAKVLVKS
ncbi:MAG: aminotransferase class I/II-fold pyridoxal phosphate-dependent enzyme [Gammaproteobacteria bacterium]